MRQNKGLRQVCFVILLLMALVGALIRANMAQPVRDYIDCGVVDVVFRQNRMIDIDPYDRFWLTVSPELGVESVQVAWDGIANRVMLRKGELLPVQYEEPGVYQIRVWQANGVELTPFTVRVFAPPEDVLAPKGRADSVMMASGDVQTMDACTVFPSFTVGRVYAGAYVTNTIDKYPIRIVSSGAGCCTLTKYGGGWSKTYTFDAAGEQSDVVDVPVGQSWTLTKSGGGGTATLSTNLPGRLSIDDLILTNGPAYAPVGESVTNRVWQLLDGDTATLFALPGPYWVTNTPANVGSVFEWTTNGVDYVPFNGLTNVFFGSNVPELTEVNVWCRSPETLRTNQWTWMGELAIGVNNLDRTKNGIEDYADGFAYCSGTGCGDAASVNNMYFRELLINLTGIDTNDSTVTVKISYPDNSVPSPIIGENVFTCAGTKVKRTLPVGDLRIWTKEGDVQRNAHSVNNGGDYVEHDQTMLLTSLTNNIVNGRLVLYLEGIRENGGAAVDATITSSTTNITRSVEAKIYNVDVALFSLMQDPSTEPQNPLRVEYQGVANEQVGYLKVRKPADGLTSSIYIQFEMEAGDQDPCYGTTQRPKLYSNGEKVHDFDESDVFTINPYTMSVQAGEYQVYLIRVPAPLTGTFVATQGPSVDVDALSVVVPPQPPSISLASKFRRVNRQGVPLPDPGPTGEGEEDRLPNQAHIDMFSLTASYSVSDFSLPLEGGELTLEFRRTATLQSRDASPNAKPLYVSEEILGPAWNTALGSRVITSLSEVGPTATVIDDLGNSYRYYKTNGVWKADMRHSFSNDALRCTLENTANPDELLFKRTHGTKLLFTAVEAGITFCTAETYYRLIEVKDRNGNIIEYKYEAPESGLLVSAIQEVRPAMNSGRRIEFDYTKNEANGKIRLTKLTDPLGREMTYVYDANNDYLMEVHYPQVPDENGVNATPTVKFTYFETAPNNRVTYINDTQLCTGSDQQTRWVAVATVTDARNHVTTYTYADNAAFEKVPVSLRADGAIIYERKPVIKQVSTDDGTATFAWGAGNNGTNIVNTVTDTKNNAVQYEFQGSVINAPTLINKTAVITKVKRTHGAIGSVEFTYSDDGYDNLLSVKDISNNIINYEYASVTNQIFNLVSKKTVAVGTLNLETSYEYEPNFNKMSKMTDAETVSTRYVFDENGNRKSVEEGIVSNGPPMRTTTFDYIGKGFMATNTLHDISGTRVTAFTPNDWGDVKHTTVYTGYGQTGQPLTTTTDRDVMGRVLTNTPPITARKVIFQYDNLDRVVTNINPSVINGLTGSPTTSFTATRYDLNGNPVRIQDDVGNVVLKEYDGLNRLTKTIVDLNGNGINDDPATDIVTSKTYDALGNVETETDGKGNIVSYLYDPLLRLTDKIFPAVTTGVHTEHYDYSGGNSGSGAFTLAGFQPTRITNKRGYFTDNEYDAAYRLKKTIRRNNGNSGLAEPTVEYAYNKTHKKITETVHNNDNLGPRTTQFFYDHLYRVTVTDTDMDGTLSSVAPGAFVSDPTGYTAGTQDIVTRTTYDKAGNPLTVTDPENMVTTNTFDAVSRLTKIEMPAVTVVINGITTSNHIPTIETTYDANSNKEIVTDANGNQTKFFYDNRDRVITTVLDLDRNGVFSTAVPGPDIVTQTQYDLTDHPVKIIDPRGNLTVTTYDNAYRARFVTAPAVPNAEEPGNPLQNPVVESVYDKNSNVTDVIDPRTVTTHTDYDAWNRPTSVTKAFGTPDAVTTTTTYDANNNIKTVTLHNNANGGDQITAYLYDEFDRKTKETLPSPDSQVRQTTWDYHQNSTVDTVTDPKGQITENFYDRDNRLIEARFHNATNTVEEVRTFDYNKLDKIEQAIDRHGTNTFVYHENRSWLLEEQRQTVNQTDYTVQSFFDPNGNRTKCVYPDTNRTLLSRYDAANRLDQITDGTGVTTYGYDKNSNRTSCALPNGLVTTNVFDALNRVTSMVNQSGATTVYSVAYGYDLVGNRLTINETVKKAGSGSTTRNLEYDYDAQYRLTSESWYEGNKVKKYDYQYDLAGNRTNMVYTFHNSVTTTTYTHDVLNRLNTTTSAGKTVTYNYDLNGNRISKVGSHPSLPKHYYTFDTLNRLIQTRDGSTNGPVIFQATYDYRTRRLTTTESGATKYFRYDGGDSFHEVANGTSNIQVEFVRGSGMGGGIGSILYSDRGATREHFTYNAVGHTVALTLQTGAVSKSDLYEAYGNIVASTGSSSNNRLANTKERSFTLGLDNHGFRYYDPEVGRYISRDPIGYGDGLNVYLYVHNNPINHIDPLGLSEQEDKSDYAQGGLTARLLRWSSNKLNQIGTDSKSNAILSNPATQAVMGFYSHMASLGANVMTPKTYVEGYKTQVEKTSDVIFTAQQQGANPVSAASQGLGYAAGNLIGYTPAIESAFGVDIASGENIEGVDRAQRGLMGGSQLLLTGTGLAASYNAALQTGKIAASSELGESGLAAMRRTVAEAGNDIPVPTGTTGIRTIMSDLTASTGNEVALFRLFSGERVIRMGGPRSVPVGSDVSRIIAHTHPSGRLALSSADINAVQNLGGKSTVIIDPKSDIGARISINKP